MKNFHFVLLLLILTSCVSQSPKSLTSSVKKFQKELNSEYRDPVDTPLRGKNFDNFKEHPFFPINLKYRVVAKFIKTENSNPFELPTSSGKTKSFKEYGKASFVIDGQELSLTLYQSFSVKKAGAKEYLFLPFRDETNEIETYGGGKYLDLKVPKSDKIIIDFNRSYHPYCAYNAFNYNCPIVPEENFLPIRIEAGVMYDDVYHD